MTDFALPVVRVVIPLNPWSISPFLAKRRERHARQALSLRPGQRLYCRFERHQGDLECAFSAGDSDTVRKPLLGETVRDWLARDASDDFLWCESVAAGIALTLVVAGHVAKDGVYSSALAAQELKLALSQLLRRNGPIQAYYGNEAARGLIEQVLTPVNTDAVTVRPAPDLLQAHLDRVLPPMLTELSEIPNIRAWNRVWRLVRYAVFAALLGTVAYLGYWAVERLTGAEVAQQPPSDRVKRIYAKLLVAPPAGDLLLGIHKDYRDFLGDEVFADFARVTQLEWAGTRVGTVAVVDRPHPLKISATVAVADDDWNGRQQARAFPRRLQDHAVRRGWGELVWDPGATTARAGGAGRRVAVGKTWFTVSRALEWSERGAQQALANQRPPPISDDGVPLRTVGLEEILADVGTVQVIGTRPSGIFETTEMQLRLQNADWLDRGVVEWIAGRLEDLPIALDSVELTTIEGGAAEDAVTIRFRLVWCAANGTTCTEPLTEADFMFTPLPTDA